LRAGFDLLQALADALPPEQLHLGHRLAGFTDHRNRLELRFSHGAQVAAGVLVGAELHSLPPEELHDPEVTCGSRLPAPVARLEEIPIAGDSLTCLSGTGNM